MVLASLLEVDCIIILPADLLARIKELPYQSILLGELLELELLRQGTVINGEPFIQLTHLLQSFDGLVGVPLDLAYELLGVLQLLLDELLVREEESDLTRQLRALPLELHLLGGDLLRQYG
jgi:hypothetical protein